MLPVRTQTTPQGQQPRGVIDSLGTGFAIVARRPWLMLVPLLLDVVLWLSPGISAGPLIDDFVSGSVGLIAAGATTPDDFLVLATQFETTAEALRDINLLSAVSWQLPTVLGGNIEAGRSIVELRSWSALFGMVAGLLAAGLILAAIYFAVVAQVVREGRTVLGSLLGSLPRVTLRYSAYVMLVTIMVVALVAVVGAFLVIGTIFGGGVIAIGIAGGLTGFLLLRVYLMFGDEAVFVSGMGPLQAARISYRVVSRSFWSVVLLFAMTTVMGMGLNVIWQAATKIPAGVLPAVVGNAFIQTGIATAFMVYFVDRSLIANNPVAAPLDPSGRTL